MYEDFFVCALWSPGTRSNNGCQRCLEWDSCTSCCFAELLRNVSVCWSLSLCVWAALHYYAPLLADSLPLLMGCGISHCECLFQKEHRNPAYLPSNCIKELKSGRTSPKPDKAIYIQSPSPHCNLSKGSNAWQTTLPITLFMSTGRKKRPQHLLHEASVNQTVPTG